MQRRSGKMYRQVGMSAQKIRVAVVGVGNCASALVQAVAHYGRRDGNGDTTGLIEPVIGPYRVEDIEIVAAFDVHAGKVGRDLAEAIHVAPNNTLRFAEVAHSGVTVLRGPTMDGLGAYVQDVVPQSPAAPVDVAEALRASGAEVLVNYLPVGSEDAARHYISAALDANCGVVNCIPVFIASNPEWADRFRRAGLPIIGDDIKSQVGATILHRRLVSLFRDRGIQLQRTYQLNFGGNTDFQNMLERERLQSKKISKTQAVTSQIGCDLPEDSVHVGPSDFVPWLQDRKWAQIRLEGIGIGGAPINLEVKLEVWDSPNSAGVVLDAIRCLRLARDRGESGPVELASAYYMKSPPVQIDDDEARDLLHAYIGAGPV